MDELLALIGQNWRLLLIYPGGLTALVTLLATNWIMPRGARLTGLHIGSARGVLIAALWLTVIALLPLPQTGWPYDLDLAVLLLLIELPYWLYLLRAPAGERMSRIVALLNVYPLLALALAALGQAAGTLVVQDINRSTGWLHWLGIGAWAITLPPLLGLGPWRNTIQRSLLTALRQIAHLGLLLAATLPAHDSTPIWTALVGYLCLLIPLWTLDRWWRGSAQRWTIWQPWIALGLLLILLGFSGQSYLTRLRYLFRLQSTASTLPPVATLDAVRTLAQTAQAGPHLHRPATRSAQFHAPRPALQPLPPRDMPPYTPVRIVARCRSHPLPPTRQAAADRPRQARTAR